MSSNWTESEARAARSALDRFDRARHRIPPAALSIVAEIASASAADATTPLDSPRRRGRRVIRAVKRWLRKVVRSRTGAPLERQTEFNAALLRVGIEALAERS